MTTAEVTGLLILAVAAIGLMGTILAAGMRLGVLNKTITDMQTQADNRPCSDHVAKLAKHTEQLSTHTEQLALHAAKLAAHAKQTAETSAVLVGMLERLETLNGREGG